MVNTNALAKDGRVQRNVVTEPWHTMAEGSRLSTAARGPLLRLPAAGCRPSCAAVSGNTANSRTGLIDGYVPTIHPQENTKQQVGVIP